MAPNVIAGDAVGASRDKLLLVMDASRRSVQGRVAKCRGIAAW